jgi:hypothetical protein
MTTAATSITAYHALIRSGELSAKCRELVAVYWRYGVLADFELAPLIGWHVSQVSARRGDLMVKDHEGHCTGTGVIIEYGTTTNPHTKREVNRYKLNIGDQPTLI